MLKKRYEIYKNILYIIEETLKNDIQNDRRDFEQRNEKHVRSDKTQFTMLKIDAYFCHIYMFKNVTFLSRQILKYDKMEYYTNI